MGAMPVPSAKLKDLIEGTVDHHASKRWPRLAEVTIRWRGSYGYLIGHPNDDPTDDEQIPLARIEYLGLADEWGFAIYQASNDNYRDATLPSGSMTGTPIEALDCACTLYLTDTEDHPS
jgi:hypothetical protein